MTIEIQSSIATISVGIAKVTEKVIVGCLVVDRWSSRGTYCLVGYGLRLRGKFRIQRSANEIIEMKQAV